MITTDINYPKELRIPLREDYGLQHGETFTTTQMASGRRRNRPTFTHVPTDVTVSWLFTNSIQAMAFESWYRDALKNGVEYFNMPLLTPLGLQNYICRFLNGGYSGPHLTGSTAWRFSATLEIIERPILPPGWGNMPDFILHMSEFDVLMNQTWPEYKG